MVKVCLFIALNVALVGNASSQSQAAPAASQTSPIQPGVITPAVVTLAHPDQTYALYLPSNYTPTRKWPIVYAFDPSAIGDRPVKLFREGAERYGYIVVGSYNSRNGPWQPEAEAAEAVINDTHARFSIDDQRMYFTGHSGGARVASRVAQMCKCAAGVVLNAAGFPTGEQPTSNPTFAVFADVGLSDANYPELIELDAKLESLKYQHWLRRFEGPHQWGPSEIFTEALAWFRVLAMKDGKEPRDDAFIVERLAAIAPRAEAMEKAGDPYFAWSEYRQGERTFDKLTDTSVLHSNDEILLKQKSVRDGAKRERQEAEQQTLYQSPVSAAIETLRTAGNDGKTDTIEQAEAKISELRAMVKHEKHIDQMRIEQRALSSIFINSIETGNGEEGAKNFHLAEYCYLFAADTDPTRPGPWRELAVLRATNGNRKGALDALRHAKETAPDPAPFAAWLKDEPAFAKFQSFPEFKALLDSTASAAQH